MSCGRVDPFAVVVEAAAGANGADDAQGRRLDASGVFNHEFKSKAYVPLAARKKTESVRVPIDGTFVVKIEVDCDAAGAVPVDESFLDGVAIGMTANAALAGVLREVHGGGILGAKCAYLLLHVHSPLGRPGLYVAMDLGS